MPRYRLRTLLIVVTVLCCAMGYLCYGWNWVRERQHELRTNFDVYFVGAGFRARPWSDEAPLLSRLGEQPVTEIFVAVPTDARMVQRLKRLFPEAKITYRTLIRDSDGYVIFPVDPEQPQNPK